MNRSCEIIEAAVATLESGSDPFARSFLLEHEVSLDEVSDLADRLALAARIYLLLIDDLRVGRVKAEASVALMARAAAHGLVKNVPVAAVAARGARIFARLQTDQEDLRSTPVDGPARETGT